MIWHLALFILILTRVETSLAGVRNVVVKSTSSTTEITAINDSVNVHTYSMGLHSDKPTLVFIHGFADYWGTWKQLMVDLSPRYHTVAIDLRGYNKSSQPEDPQKYSIDELSSDVNAVLTRLNISTAILLGHDVGALVAFAVANKYPKQIKGVVSFGFPHPEDYNQAYTSDRHREFRYIKSYLKNGAEKEINWAKLFAWRKQFSDYNEFLLTMQKSSKRGMIAAYAANFTPQILSRKYNIQCPTYIFRGLKDNSLPQDVFANTKDRFPSGFNEIVFHEGGHDIHLEFPTVVLDELQTWLERLQSTPDAPISGRKSLIDSQIANGYSVRTSVDGTIYALTSREVFQYTAEDYKKKTIGPLKFTEHIDLLPDVQMAEGHKFFALVSDFYSIANTNGDGRMFLLPVSSKEVDTTAARLIGQEPNLHRVKSMRWENNKQAILGASIYGSGATPPNYVSPPGHVVLFEPPGGTATGPWKKSFIAELPLIHGLYVHTVQSKAIDDFYTASAKGIHKFQFDSVSKTWAQHLISEGTSMNGWTGASEVTIGQINRQQSVFSIEPWHGSHVVNYNLQSGAWRRTVIDTSSTGGHGLIAIDVDDDGTDEVFACYQGIQPGVYYYKHNLKTQQWSKQKLAGFFPCSGIAVTHKKNARSILAIGGRVLMSIDLRDFR